MNIKSTFVIFVAVASLLFAGQTANDKIPVNSIHPAFIWTPLVESLLKDQGGDIKQLRKNLDGMHPLGHMGEPNAECFYKNFAVGGD